jgi:nucleotide-binding universal stress UspA family protein
MEKHILICVSDDMAASFSMNFVASFFKTPCDVRMTLLFVTPKDADRSALAKGNGMLEKARTWFENRQFCDPGKIDLKTLPSHGDPAKMIVQEAHKELYDAVLIGRRNSSIFEELFDYSVSHRILWEEIGFPIWFCCTPSDGKRSGVLLCVDNDEPSMRMADHVGFILNDNEGHDITLFHVDTGKSQTDADYIFTSAREILIANGVAEERIKQLSVRSSNIFKAIKNQSSKGGYAVVAVGRGQHRKSAREAVMPGSVSVKLLRSAEPETLWISK